MNRRIFYGFLVTALGVNLFFGAQIYFYSAHASQKDDPYENYKLLADVLEKVRQEYVDGDKLTYQDLIHGALKGMLNSLDPHSEFMDPEKFDELKKETEGEFGGVGIVVEMKDKVLTVLTPMEDSPGYRAGIMPQDQIIKIDGKSASHYDFDDAVKELHGEPGTTVRLTIRRPSTGVVKEFALQRAVIKVDTVKDIDDEEQFPVGPDGIGYVRLTQFGEKTSDELDVALKKLSEQGLKALILDLRENPGGLLEQAGQVCEKFLPRGELIVSTEGRGPVARSEYRANGHGKRIDLPMVVLVNGNSASASEIVAGCLQDLQPITHAIIIGEQTFGKGSVQSILPLTDGSAIRLTTAKYYTPSHKVIHQHGITPDIVVPMSAEDEENWRYKHYPGAMQALDPKEREQVAAVRDRQLDRAMDVLKGILLYAQRSPAPSRVAAAFRPAQ
ncbi:MAG TPA: S41 family peptidase [Verrucomicrobiae bacterium]|nr:S41 family peptidase [Verrucomicrobiae bacterium]